MKKLETKAYFTVKNNQNLIIRFLKKLDLFIFFCEIYLKIFFFHLIMQVIKFSIMKKLYVSNANKSVRLFKLDWMNALSKVHWTVPMIIYLPVTSYFLFSAITSPELQLLPILLLFLGGVVIWTISEYFIHRYVFHFPASTKFGKKLIFLFHGVHHDYPNDSKRLVMPPAASIPLASLFYLLFRSLFTGDALFPFFAGFISGYLVYDMIHYATHHAKGKGGKLWMVIKTHHLKHPL